jgi:hypothetical protein
MSKTCGCCAGIEPVTPQPETNRPGLPSLAYRAGTYATFFESMVARLSNLYLDVPLADGSGNLQRIYPLSKLTSREPSDPSMALLDAWAIVADVLTFYQERIAEEGYLLTATERLSVLELARLVGYRLRPGVSASVYLAFTTANGFNGTIPAGTRAQSIPGTGETAQFFETSEDSAARDTWNALHPRLTRPQVITLASDQGTDALTRDTLYFQGISTNLKTGDALLIVLGEGSGQQVVRFVESVDAQADQKRTEVTLQEPPPSEGTTAEEAAKAALNPFIGQATSIFAGSDLAGDVAAILTTVVDNVTAVNDDNQKAANMVRAAIPAIQEQHGIAVARAFSRLVAWTAEILDVLRDLAPLIEDLDFPAGTPSGSPSILTSGLATSALSNLWKIIEPLALPPSLQPANPQRLVRTLQQTFSPQADTAPRLLAAFRPAAAPAIYPAWSGVSTPSSQVEVYALRAKAAPFGHNAPKQVPVVQSGVPTPQEWPASSEDQSVFLSLDAAYDKIIPNSWVVVNSPSLNTPQFITRVPFVQTTSRSDYGMAARVTQLNVGQSWASLTQTNHQPDISQIRRVTVWAQPELLDLAEEPLDTDVEGDTIELQELYDGFESGRWIIVSGERTDIPNTTGVTASELVMIAAVTQGSRAPLCAKFPPNFVPFSKVYYTTSANSQGDRLVVGEPVDLSQIQALPGSDHPNQQYCDQAQLAPGVYVNAYVPAADEKKGNLPDFEGLLVDPKNNNVPYPGGTITNLDQVFAWRISTAPVHTILTLANSLAYKYDSSSVTIYGNVTKATHGQTVGEILGDGDGSQAFQTFALHQKPLTFVSAPVSSGAESTLVTRVNDIEWYEANDLASLGPTDHEYITQTDDSDQTTVVFGNGQHGARVPTGSANVKAVYRYGIGAAGNVQAGQISQLATHPQGAQGVINPLPASGGADRDDIGQARRNTPIAVLALDRLVSVQDYADFSRTFAGIGKASSVRLTDSRRQLVHVTIAGAEDIPIDPTSDLYQNLVQALYAYGDPYEPIQVAVRKLKLLVISARVKILPDYEWESVQPMVRSALLDAYAFDQRDLGQSAFLSEAIGIMQMVEGVSYVNVQFFDAVAEDVSAEQLAGLASTLTLNNFVQANLARVKTAATLPSQRILPAELAILTPDIPDTLILTEITA